MNHLLVGGRPPLALAKDCCFRGISSLTDDIQHLQKQKSKWQTDYEDMEKQANDKIEILQLQNERLCKELNDLEEMALSVETEANSSLGTLHKLNIALKVFISI